MEPEPRTRAWLAGLCAVGAGCGDLGDAQLPLPIHGGGSREPAVFELTPEPSGARVARAAASIALRPAPGEACPDQLEALLPDESAARTLVTGEGRRAADGDGVGIACSVRESPDQAGVFEVLLSLRRGRLWFRGAGLLGSRAAAPVPGASGSRAPGVLALRLSLRDTTELSADCPFETREVLDGAVWFHALACRAPAADGGGACDVAVSALFENCSEGASAFSSSGLASGGLD